MYFSDEIRHWNSSRLLKCSLFLGGRGIFQYGFTLTCIQSFLLSHYDFRIKVGYYQGLTLEKFSRVPIRRGREEEMSSPAESWERQMSLSLQQQKSSLPQVIGIHSPHISWLFDLTCLKLLFILHNSLKLCPESCTHSRTYYSLYYVYHGVNYIVNNQRCDFGHYIEIPEHSHTSRCAWSSVNHFINKPSSQEELWNVRRLHWSCMLMF